MLLTLLLAVTFAADSVHFPFVKASVRRTPNTDFYEIPTIKRMVAPMRWMINRGMKSGIDDRSARDAR